MYFFLECGMAVEILQFKLNKLDLQFIDTEFSIQDEDKFMLVASVNYPRAGKPLIEVIKTMPVAENIPFDTHNEQIVFMDKIEMSGNTNIAVDVKLLFVNNKSIAEKLFANIFEGFVRIFISGINIGNVILDKAVKGSLNGVLDSLIKAKAVAEIASTSIRLQVADNQSINLTVEPQTDADTNTVNDYYLEDENFDDVTEQTRSEVPYLNVARLTYSINIVE